jgi:hypothetical protein
MKCVVVPAENVVVLISSSGQYDWSCVVDHTMCGIALFTWKFKLIIIWCAIVFLHYNLFETFGVEFWSIYSPVITLPGFFSQWCLVVRGLYKYIFVHQMTCEWIDG